jgi:hypothetical protein
MKHFHQVHLVPRLLKLLHLSNVAHQDQQALFAVENKLLGLDVVLLGVDGILLNQSSGRA